MSSGWGDKFDEAWSAASEVGRKAAADVAVGSVLVGPTPLRRLDAVRGGIKWVSHVGVHGAQWAARKAQEASHWAATQAKRAESWAARKAKQGVRSGLKSAAEKVFSGASVAQDAWRGATAPVKRVAQTVSDVIDRVSTKFGRKKLRSSAHSCPAGRPARDVDFDGSIVGSGCIPLSHKGDEVTKDILAKAESSAVASESPCCKKKRARGEASGTIVYVNGINTTKAEHCQSLRAIAEQTCKKVYGVYNATEEPKIGSFSLADAVQTSKDRRLIRQAQDGKLPKSADGRNPAVDTLTMLIDAKGRAGEPLEVWAHSQGGAVTSLALYGAKRMGSVQGRKDPLGHVSVKSYGAAAPSWVAGPRYEHYVHVNDATPVLYGLGDDPDFDETHAGKNARVIRFSGEPQNRLAEVNGDQSDDAHFIPHPSKYHKFDGTGNAYLQMHRVEHGGCPE
jgi:hypothetical protein